VKQGFNPWLLANNKTLTRDNLAKRKSLDDKTCLFYSEAGSVVHLFFECCVARTIWNVMAQITGYPVIQCFEDITKMWLRGKICRVINVLNTAVVLVFMENQE
jgi:hypothetical protein